jgi:glycosyltransferase involved in cell wall biosynthesis
MTPIRRVVVVGPASPSALASHLSGEDGKRAAGIKGLGAPPVNSLVSALLECGVQVELITLTPEVTQLHHFSGLGLDIWIGPYRDRARYRTGDFYAKERRTISELLARVQGDIVHAHWTYEFALPCERVAAPVLITAHDAPLTIFRLNHDAYRLVRTMLAYRARLGIRTLSAVSPYLADRWRREMAYRRPIMVVPNIAAGLKPMRHRVTPGHPVILDVADDGKRKNISTLIRAFDEVRRARPDAVLRLVGPGLGPSDPLACWARARRFDAGVEFAGPVDSAAVANHLAEATVFPHVSREEAHPMSVCEAMQVGLPIIGGLRSGGVPWTLADGRCGLLVDVTDPRAVAAAILRLLADPSLAQRLGTAARRRAVTTFGPDSVARGYLNAYAAAIREQAGTRVGNDQVTGRSHESGP